MIKGICKRCKKMKMVFEPENWWHDGLCEPCSLAAADNDEDEEDWED